MFYHLAYLRPSSHADEIYPVQRRARAEANRRVGRALARTVARAVAAGTARTLAVARRWASARAETARRARLERDTIRELSALSDAALADIGIRRGDIRSIARGFGLVAQAPALDSARDSAQVSGQATPLQSGEPARAVPTLVVSRPAPRPMLPVEAGLVADGAGRLKACA